MKHHLKAAEFKYYNANNRGNDVGDCVKRAISLAFDISYTQTGKLLNAKMHEKRQSIWNILPVFKDVISDLGGGSMLSQKEAITVDQFADANNRGIYLLCVGKNMGDTNHLVCIRDGQIWDSWNCSDYFVTAYWDIKRKNAKAINKNLNKQFMENASTAYIEPIVTKQIEQYAQKQNMKYSEIEVKCVGNSFKVTCYVRVYLDADDVIWKFRTYKFQIAVVVEPTWTEDEAIEYIKKTSKQRTYDRMWTVNEQEKKLREAYTVAKRKGITDFYDETVWITDAEDRFIRTLPGWIRPLIQFIDIQRPGVFPDSYSIRISPHPDDTLHEQDEKIRFEGWTADEVNAQIDHYRKTWLAPEIDYSPLEIL